MQTILSDADVSTYIDHVVQLCEGEIIEQPYRVDMNDGKNLLSFDVDDNRTEWVKVLLEAEIMTVPCTVTVTDCNDNQESFTLSEDGSWERE
jgi:hypothetical protein